jgi:hypothetical protein
VSGVRPRAYHPVVALRWLRAGVLGVVAATTLLYLMVADRAGEQLATAQRTQTAIDHIAEAQAETRKAKAALDAVSKIGKEAMGLTGTGADFANATARISSHLTSATESNGAGEQGLSHIQFVQGQLETTVQMANTAVMDGAPAVLKVGEALDASEKDAPGTGAQGEGVSAAPVKDTKETEDPEADEEAASFTGDLDQSLAGLKKLELDAKERQETSRWRDPRILWPLFMAPLAVMLVLVWATGLIVARSFRRYPSPTLLQALLATASICVCMCRFTPLHAAIALPVLAAAGGLAYLAYRPRLAEYRFPRS